MKNLNFHISSVLIFVLSITTILLSSCSPACEDYMNITTSITPSFIIANECIVISTEPSDFLENRYIYAYSN